MRPLPSSAAALLVLAALAMSCTSTVVAPIPQPLPETLEWAAAGSGGGAFLGIKARENLTGTFDALDFSAGLRVTRVVEDSPAAAAGVVVDDVLLAFDGVPTDDVGTLDALLAGAGAEVPVLLEIQRGDTVFDVPVTPRAQLGAEASATPSYVLDPTRTRAGWADGHGGAVLVSSRESAPFRRASVPIGSVVHSIDGEPVRSGRALIRHVQALAPGTRIAVGFTTPEDRERSASVVLARERRRITRVAVPILLNYESEPSGERTTLSLLDFWLISLFRYERDGAERHWSVLRFFRFATGVGALAE